MVMRPRWHHLASGSPVHVILQFRSNLFFNCVYYYYWNFPDLAPCGIGPEVQVRVELSPDLAVAIGKMCMTGRKQVWRSSVVGDTWHDRKHDFSFPSPLLHIRIEITQRMLKELYFVNNNLWVIIFVRNYVDCKKMKRSRTNSDNAQLHIKL